MIKTNECGREQNVSCRAFMEERYEKAKTGISTQRACRTKSAGARLHIKFNKENVVSDKYAKVIPLGGLSRIGCNITLIETARSIVAIDCGMAFPDTGNGVDRVIPDISYIKNNIDKFKGFVITHGHEDHIGALPFIMDDKRYDIYSLRLPAELIKKKFIAEGVTDFDFIHTVKRGDKVVLGDITVEFIGISHSIPDSSALAIYTPGGLIFHTGDFKLDLYATGENKIDIARISELAKEKLLLMLSDSTNAQKDGWTTPENNIQNEISDIFALNPCSRIIISTFASNINRINEIINAAEKTGRPVAVDGRSISQALKTAKELKYLNYKKISDIYDEETVNAENSVIIVTGSQGEKNSSLAKIADGEHPRIKLRKSDVIVFSSKVIPGNQKNVEDILNKLVTSGIRNIEKDIHTSGHACRNELNIMAKLVDPKYIIPVHGDPYQRLNALENYVASGFNKNNVFMASEGEVFILEGKNVISCGKIPTRDILLEGYSEVKEETLTERKVLAENGCVVIYRNKDGLGSVHNTGIFFSKQRKDYITQKLAPIALKYINDDEFKARASDELFAITGKRPEIIIISEGEKYVQ